MLMLMIGLMAASLASMDKTRHQLDKVVDDHMTKVALSKQMRTAARSRTLILFRLIHISDPFDRDDAWMKYNQKAIDFIRARNAILDMPISEIESGLLTEQGKKSRVAIPIQNKILDLINEGYIKEASSLLNVAAVPAQANVLRVVDDFDVYQNAKVREAQNWAIEDMESMRRLILIVGIAALMIGVAIALIVMRVIRQRTEIDIYHATHDTLTRLPNRALLLDRLEQSLLNSKRSGNTIALMFVDVDRFKSINDTYGHATGDLALLSVCDTIQGQLRETDTLARLSGDEFIVLMEKAENQDDIGRIAERILQAFKKPVLLKGISVEIGVSIGVSLHPEHGETPETLISNADTAMYESKKKGRNCWSLFQST
ncbi:diguanylate cyclase [Candidatus Reidiella endopervernicosa]|nr:diguanylate cyclase [Candidatus Reidiella endopervernicosa]